MKELVWSKGIGVSFEGGFGPVNAEARESAAAEARDGAVAAVAAKVVRKQREGDHALNNRRASLEQR
nr:hypothetical protein [Tanacetum cinerariifolium]